MNRKTGVSSLSVPLDRDIFLRVLIRELAGILEDVVGYDEAAGFISLVGQNVGEWLNGLYKNVLGVERLSVRQVAGVLVDLKARIQGGFSILEQDAGKIVLVNQACPFGEMVLDRPSMCMMTSNVFGVIAAENLGYAKVEIRETIASGSSGCKVIVYLETTPAARAARGREYFGATER